MNDDNGDDTMPDDLPKPKRGPLTEASPKDVRSMTDVDFRIAVRDHLFTTENHMANIDLNLRNHVKALDARMDRWEKFTYALLGILGLESIALLFAGLRVFFGIGG